MRHSEVQQMQVATWRQVHHEAQPGSWQCSKLLFCRPNTDRVPSVASHAGWLFTAHPGALCTKVGAIRLSMCCGLSAYRSGGVTSSRPRQ